MSEGGAAFSSPWRALRRSAYSVDTSPTKPQRTAPIVDTKQTSPAKNPTISRPADRKTFKPKTGRMTTKNETSAHVPRRSLRVPARVPDPDIAKASAPRRHGARGLTLNRDLEPEQIVDRLAAADELRAAFGDEDRGGTRHAVVVRGHAERVRTGGRDGEQIVALRLGQLDGVDQDIAGFAMLARDAIRPRGRLGSAVRQQRLVA